MDRIRRIHRQESWTSFPNATLEDERLSWGALGLLAFLMSKPDGAKTDTDDLAGVRGAESSEDGLEGFLAELEEAGYYDPESGVLTPEPM